MPSFAHLTGVVMCPSSVPRPVDSRHWRRRPDPHVVHCARPDRRHRGRAAAHVDGTRPALVPLRHRGTAAQCAALPVGPLRDALRRVARDRSRPVLRSGRSVERGPDVAHRPRRAGLRHRTFRSVSVSAIAGRRGALQLRVCRGGVSRRRGGTRIRTGWTGSAAAACGSARSDVRAAGAQNFPRMVGCPGRPRQCARAQPQLPNPLRSTRR